MDQTVVEDFQNHHNPNSIAQTPRLLRQHASLEPYGQESDNCENTFDECFGDQDASSPSGSAQQSSDPDEAVFEISSRHSSPRTSNHSDDDVSEFPPHEVQDENLFSEPQRVSSPYTPFKTRSPFRNPSSVRAIQMDTTPPSYLPSPSQGRYKFATPSRNGTPRSIRSHHSTMCSPSKISSPKKVKKEYPLVLLHLTLLPIPISYSVHVMESVLPAYILENWKILQEKATDTVLARGILIPHPKEDYDLLEERLLESLELKLPRILKCGHFHLDPEEEDEILESDVDDDDSENDQDICEDCGRRVRDGRFGSGTGHKRWDIKLFAANGLMRAGAWSAAWREMERVDVEIMPWMDDDMKRELELRRAEEERQIPDSLHAIPDDILDAIPQPATMDDARMREIYGESAQPYLHKPFPPTPKASPPMPSTQGHHSQEVPLWLLLRNYIYLIAQDRRNVALVVLSVLVLLLSITASRKNPPPPPLAYIQRHDISPSSGVEHVHSLISSPPSFSAVAEASPTVAVPEPMQQPSRKEAIDEELGEMAAEF